MMSAVTSATRGWKRWVSAATTSDSAIAPVTAASRPQTSVGIDRREERPLGSILRFMTGSPAAEAGRAKSEGPAHEVKIEASYMEEHEVTWAEYLLFLDNYHRLASTRPVDVPPDRLADAVTFPTPMYEMEAGPALERM